MIFPPGSINVVIIEIHVIEGLMSYWPMSKPILTVECYEIRTLWKDDLIIIINFS